jgi:predicted  nucleic acid-binding Zn-ribbon protein
MLFSKKRNQIQEKDQNTIQHLQSDLHVLERKLSDTNQLLDAQARIQSNQLLGTEMLEKIRQSLAEKAEALIEERKDLRKLDQVFSDARLAVERLQSRSQDISEHAQSGAKTAEELSRSAGYIQELISNIQRVSDQTNLLALNAAIEAARAGEQGRGFAVVAAEVRQLAGRAGEASKQIEEIVRNIVAHVDRIHAVVLETLDSATEIAASSVQIDEVVHAMIDNSSHLQIVIRNTTTAAFLNTVKVDHAVWKADVYKHIRDGNFSAHLTNHQECRLGKWYFEGYGASHYSSLSSFQALDAPHCKVHESGLQALEAGQEGNIPAMVAALENMELASQEVVDDIDRLLASVDVSA